MESIHERIERDLQTAQRVGLQQRLAVVPVPGRPLRVAPDQPARGSRCCANCAGSVELGAVLIGSLAYCSIECSLDGRSA